MGSIPGLVNLTEPPGRGHLQVVRFLYRFNAERHRSVGLENRGSLVRSPARPIFFPRINDSQSDRIHCSLIVVRCFDNGYVGKQPEAWKDYRAEYCLKELQESMDSCTG